MRLGAWCNRELCVSSRVDSVHLRCSLASSTCFFWRGPSAEQRPGAGPSAEHDLLTHSRARAGSQPPAAESEAPPSLPASPLEDERADTPLPAHPDHGAASAKPAELATSSGGSAGGSGRFGEAEGVESGEDEDGEDVDEDWGDKWA
jgi:hypothetical protein